MTEERATVRVWLGGICVAASAAALVLTAPDCSSLWWLLPVALVPMIVAQYRLLPRRWAPLGVAVVGAAYWATVILLSSGVTLAWQRALLLLAATAVVYAIAWLDLRFTAWTRYRFFLIQIPCVWVGLEILLGLNPVTGSTVWLGYRMAPTPGLIQPVSVLGTPTLTFLLLALSYGIALLVIALIDRRAESGLGVAGTTAGGAAEDGGRVSLRPAVFALGAVLAAAVVWCGASLLIVHDVRQAMGPTVRVAVVQVGFETNPSHMVPPWLQQARSVERDVVEPLAAATRDAAAQGAQLVVWPEEVLHFDPLVEHAAQIAGIAGDNGVYLVAPFSVGWDAASPNKALVLGPDGRTLGVCNKVHPVVAEGEAFDQQITPLAFDADFGAFGVAICFDNHFVDVVPEIVDAGARLIAAPTGIWPAEAREQIQTIVFRAVENRVAYAKADVGYSSVIVRPDGTLAAWTLPEGAPAAHVLVADVPLGPGGSPFSGIGRLFPWVYVAGLGLIALGYVVLAWRRRASGMRA